MDQTKLQSILDALPPKTMRSQLEPFRQLIMELRSRDRSYREIARILAEQCQIQVVPSTIHDFVRVRAHEELKKAHGIDKTKRASGGRSTAADSQPLERVPSDVSQRIEALKRRQIPESKPKPVFTYEEDEPLKLMQRSDKPNRS
jgi:IS30 family transposase